MSENNQPAESTHFGYKTVPADDKAKLVRGVFDSVASRYDLMNDLMSGGLHRFWKRFTIDRANVRKGQRVRDLAGGTGDLAMRFAKLVGDTGEVVLADINHAMLEQGRRRMIGKGLGANVSIAQVDAESLPFDDASFDCITIAFGLRNVTDKDAALRSMFRVLKPLGKFIAKDEESYQYLAESIRMHPDQETLKEMMEAAGFERCRFHNLTGGIVALHIGYRL